MIGRICLWLCLPLLGGCAGMYFEDAGAPPTPPPRHALADLPYDEYWTGLIFDGNKIGFTHLRIGPDAEQRDLHRLHARAVDAVALVLDLDSAAIGRSHQRADLFEDLVVSSAVRVLVLQRVAHRVDGFSERVGARLAREDGEGRAQPPLDGQLEEL